MLKVCCFELNFFILFLFLPYTLNDQISSSAVVNVFSMTVHVFCNLFWKIYSLFGQILITCLKCPRASFLLSYYREKIRWERGCYYPAKGRGKILSSYLDKRAVLAYRLQRSAENSDQPSLLISYVLFIIDGEERGKGENMPIFMFDIQFIANIHWLN